MSIGSRLLQVAVLAGAALTASASGSAAQGDPCSAQDKRQACSYVCCGRRACPPSCEVDCVKLCVDACSAPAARQVFSSQLRNLQLRCGNRSVR
ncbi:MAG: hypothetical protein F9K29_24610 [Hyphomicrobiaceae bacterium]|nr:MAG: hypothetical protein F9K29_24610 [Hyphomicrobiaceae bacterium]